MSISSSVYNLGAQFRVTAVGEFNGQADVMNVYEYFKTDAAPQSGADVLIDLEAILRGLYQLVRLINNIRTVWHGIRVEELDGSNATGLIGFAGGSIPGFLDTEAVPSGVAALIRFPTGIKNLQLRKFIGTLDESRTSPGGNITGTGLTELGDIAAYLTSTQSLIGDWHYSYKRGSAGPIVMPTTAIVNVVPSYQRRRRVGTGS